jgi:hypothetical protein
MKETIIVGKQKCGCNLIREIEIKNGKIRIHDISDGSGCGKVVDYGIREFTKEIAKEVRWDEFCYWTP